MLRAVKPRFAMLTVLLCSLVFSSCGEGKASKPIAGPPRPGALYSFSDGEGGYRVGKVLAVDDEAVFVRWYANRWSARPSMTEVRKATNAVFVGFSPQTFAGMQPVLLEMGTVAAEDSSEYEVWKRSDQEVF